jgi:hypothetical protein
MKRLAVVCLCLFLARPAGAEAESNYESAADGASEQSVKAVGPMDPKLAAEIPRLVRELGSEVFHTREQATNRLQEIGAPALDAIRQAASSSRDEEVRRRATHLLRVIRPLRSEVVNSARFRLRVDQTWVVPKMAGECSVRLALEITNLSAEQRRFKLLDTVGLRLENEAGQSIPLYAKRTSLLRRPCYSPALGQGDRYVIEHFQAKVRLDAAGNLSFCGTDGFGGSW